MKKTITAMAIAGASSTAFALQVPPTGVTPKARTICLSTYTDSNDLLYVGSCDRARNNTILKREVLANGCAESQVAMKISEWVNDKGQIVSTSTSTKIAFCLRPNVAQL